MRRLVVLCCLAVTAAPPSAHAGEVPPTKIAKVRHETEKALAAIDQAHGSRKPSEMTTAERSQVAREQAAATAKVLDQEGVTAKDFARSEARMSLEARAEAAREKQKLQEKDRESAATGSEPPAAADSTTDAQGLSVEYGDTEGAGAGDAPDGAPSDEDEVEGYELELPAEGSGE